jgi:hypothetical protein
MFFKEKIIKRLRVILLRKRILKRLRMLRRLRLILLKKTVIKRLKIKLIINRLSLIFLKE